jgi:hypothetical protein
MEPPISPNPTIDTRTGQLWPGRGRLVTSSESKWAIWAVPLQR